MSDYISKSAFIKEIKDIMPTSASRGVFLALIDDAPTVDETEIIRKAFERVVERLMKKGCEARMNTIEYISIIGRPKITDKTEYGKSVAYLEAIKILKEECGISE